MHYSLFNTAVSLNSSADFPISDKIPELVSFHQTCNIKSDLHTLVLYTNNQHENSRLKQKVDVPFRLNVSTNVINLSTINNVMATCKIIIIIIIIIINLF